MLIEHTSGSTEDKPETKNVVVRYGGQQDASTSKVSLVNQPSMCHNSPQNSHTVNPKSTPEKSMLSRKVNTGQQQESQCSSIFGQPFDLGSCANMYGLPKSKSPPKFSLFGPCVDQSQRWSNLRGNPSCSIFVQTLAAINLSFFPTCELKQPSGARTDQKRRDDE